MLATAHAEPHEALSCCRSIPLEGHSCLTGTKVITILLSPLKAAFSVRGLDIAIASAHDGLRHRRRYDVKKVATGAVNGETCCVNSTDLFVWFSVVKGFGLVPAEPMTHTPATVLAVVISGRRGASHFTLQEPKQESSAKFRHLIGWPFGLAHHIFCSRCKQKVPCVSLHCTGTCLASTCFTAFLFPLFPLTNAVLTQEMCFRA